MRALRARGDSVVAVARHESVVDDVEVQRCDVLDKDSVRESAGGADSALLAFGKVSRRDADSEEMHRLHVDAVRSALAGLRAAKVKRAVLISTSGTIAVSDDASQIADERSPVPHALIGRWPYYRSKLYGERAALQFNEPGFEVVIVNPSLLLGPGDTRRSSTRDVELFLQGLLPALPSGGIAMVDVRDAAQGALLALERGEAGERYLLSAANLPLDLFFGKLARLSGKPLPRLKLPRRPELALWGHWLFEKTVERLGGSVAVDRASVDQGSRFWYCDAGKARDQLGFRTRPLEDTLRETVRDILGQQAR